MVQASPEHPILVDGYLTGALRSMWTQWQTAKMLLSAVSWSISKRQGFIPAIRHVLPPYSLGRYQLDEIRRVTRLLALELKVKGLMNLQLALKDGEIFVLEVNPRASRTIPFVSKAIGIPLAKSACESWPGRRSGNRFTQEANPHM